MRKMEQTDATVYSGLKFFKRSGSPEQSLLNSESVEGDATKKIPIKSIQFVRNGSNSSSRLESPDAQSPTQKLSAQMKVLFKIPGRQSPPLNLVADGRSPRLVNLNLKQAKENSDAVKQ